MIQPVFHANLPDRAVICVHGPDWRPFLQGLVTQDVEHLAPGQARFAALLTPQGRVLFDLFIIGREDGCLIDCAGDQREALLQKLTMYRLRAKAAIAPSDLVVSAAWGDVTRDPSAGWVDDPRLPGLGSRGYGADAPLGWRSADETDYLAHCLRLGVPSAEDWGSDKTYPIEANFDLLDGIDFRKGCFVGQETTSRMKRRGTIKNRMAPIEFVGPAPEPGTELLSGELRAGVVLSGTDGRAMALLRLDRLEAGTLHTADGRSWRVIWPEWLKAHVAA